MHQHDLPVIQRRTFFRALRPTIIRLTCFLRSSMNPFTRSARMSGRHRRGRWLRTRCETAVDHAIRQHSTAIACAGGAGRDRTRRAWPLKPTPAGRLLIKHTMQIRLLHTDLEHDLRSLSPGTSGSAREEERVSVAVNADSIATWALPAFDLLVRRADCRWKSSPTIRISLRTGCARDRFSAA